MVTLICLICTWAFIGLGLWRIGQVTRQGLHHLQRLHRIPCDRCIYATGDYRLPCTVRPATAFSEAAIDCQDYQSPHSPHPSTEKPSCLF